jgi:hypothetical protein
MVDFFKLGFLPEVVSVERIEPLNVPLAIPQEDAA